MNKVIIGVLYITHIARPFVFIPIKAFLNYCCPVVGPASSLSGICNGIQTSRCKRKRNRTIHCLYFVLLYKANVRSFAHSVLKMIENNLRWAMEIIKCRILTRINKEIFSSGVWYVTIILEQHPWAVSKQEGAGSKLKTGCEI